MCEENNAMTTQTGKQSITFEKPPWIISSGCVAGTKEAEGPIGHEIDLVGEDDNFGCDIWEEAESTLQKEALTIALGKAGLKAEELRYLFAGDLLGQSMATSFGLQQFDLPLFGLYGACSTAGESLALAAMTVSAGRRRLLNRLSVLMMSFTFSGFAHPGSTRSNNFLLVVPSRFARRFLARRSPLLEACLCAFRLAISFGIFAFRVSQCVRSIHAPSSRTAETPMLVRPGSTPITICWQISVSGS